jgi:hypothetical protein
LELRSESDDWLGLEVEAMPPTSDVYRPLDVKALLQNGTPVEPNELVQIEELKIVRIKPWAATLAHSQERQVRVRVEYQQASGIAERLNVIKQSLEEHSVKVRGRVLITRDKLLEMIVQKAFNDVDEDPERVFSGLEQQGPYSNPLELYPTLLDKMLEGRRSIIHGDLHLRNILVDRDGRPWLIDFGQVRQGHTLFDFIKLETYIRLDVLSKASSFTLAQYAQFEEALANAHYGLWAVKMPSNHELLKAFNVIRSIRNLAGHLYPQKTLAETYFRCLLLYNIAVLKYARQAALGEEIGAEKRAHQLQAARLCFITAAVQAHWLKSPTQPKLQS